MCLYYMRFIFRILMFFLVMTFFGCGAVLGGEAFIERGTLDGADVADALGCDIVRYNVKLPVIPEDNYGVGYNGDFWVEEYRAGKKNPRIIDKDIFGFGKGGECSAVIKFPDRHSPLFTITLRDYKGFLNRDISHNPAGISVDAEPSSWTFLEEREKIVFNQDIILAIRTEGRCEPAFNVTRLPDILEIKLGGKFDRILVFKCRIEEIRPLKKKP